MNTVHLDPRHIRTIVEILGQHPSVEKAAVFGSRALGTQKEASDVDIVLYGNVDERTIGRIRNAIDDTTLPYFFDVVSHNSIHQPALLEHIEKHGAVIFERKTVSL
ncbi:MAG: nucleotidyltransferase domain-containing protein [Candidatus Peribacteraceae bacterium]|nr:nucleotidyltransferase domain-containing protein [Candidatus Peribacteraceae bacterium]MBP9850128.1 nucleotidyltransferase domain-containing protein [Candidatus Peribacteraceae bacterium]